MKDQSEKIRAVWGSLPLNEAQQALAARALEHLDDEEKNDVRKAVARAEAGLSGIVADYQSLRYGAPATVSPPATPQPKRRRGTITLIATTATLMAGFGIGVAAVLLFGHKTLDSSLALNALQQTVLASLQSKATTDAFVPVSFSVDGKVLTTEGISRDSARYKLTVNSKPKFKQLLAVLDRDGAMVFEEGEDAPLRQIVVGRIERAGANQIVVGAKGGDLHLWTRINYGPSVSPGSSVIAAYDPKTMAVTGIAPLRGAD